MQSAFPSEFSFTSFLHFMSWTTVIQERLSEAAAPQRRSIERSPMRLFSHLTTMPPRCLLVESSWTRRSFHGKSLPAPHLSPPLNKLKGMETAQKTHYLRILKKSKKLEKIKWKKYQISTQPYAGWQRSTGQRLKYCVTSSNVSIILIISRMKSIFWESHEWIFSDLTDFIWNEPCPGRSWTWGY